jgi:inositol-phosphate phosphatase/L-galactose 1-phosphate phosphatase/histidinol-phosphatase
METQINITEVKNFITDIVYKSGEIAKKYFRTNLPSESKNDFSPVTLADKKIEEFLTLEISKKYPTHTICGEEAGYEMGENSAKAKFKWFIDPLDGTASFIAGRPLFTTLVGFAIDDVPVLGVVFQPISNELWVGENYNGIKQASFNGAAINVSKTKIIDEAVIATTSPDLFGIEGYGIFSKAKEKANITVFGGDAYNYMMLAMGNIDAVIEEGLKPHDFCALVPIIQAAGGTAKTFEGENVNVNYVQNLIATATDDLFNTIKKFAE